MAGWSRFWSNAAFGRCRLRCNTYHILIIISIMMQHHQYYIESDDHLIITNPWPSSAEGRLEYQKLNQTTTTLWSWVWDFCIQLDSLRREEEEDEEEDDEDEEEPKSCFKIAQNRVCCSLGYIFRYIGTPNFSEKVLWVYSHLKSEFFSDNIGQKLT